MKNTLLNTALTNALQRFYGTPHVPENRPAQFVHALNDGLCAFLEEDRDDFPAFTTSARAAMFLANVHAYGYHWAFTFAELYGGPFLGGLVRNGYVIEPVQCGDTLAQLGLSAGLFPFGGDTGFDDAGVIDGYAVVRRGAAALALLTIRSDLLPWSVSFADGMDPDPDLVAFLDAMIRERVIAPLSVAPRCQLPGGELRHIDLCHLAREMYAELVIAWEAQARHESLSWRFLTLQVAS